MSIRAITISCKDDAQKHTKLNKLNNRASTACSRIAEKFSTTLQYIGSKLET